MSIAVSHSLETYLQEINRFAPLTPEEEFNLAVRYHKTGDLEAAHRLVTANLRYVVKIALEYRNYGVKLADLIQEGNIGLMVAVKKFNPYKGYRLITYATYWIRHFIQEFIIRSKGLVRRGSRLMKQKLFYRKGNVALSGRSTPSVPDDVSGGDLSLDAAVSDDDDRTTHLDMLVSREPGQEEALSRSEERAIVKKEVSSALAALSDRERLVIESRVMAEKPLSLQALGDMMGLTRERIRQIEKEALKKLRKNLSEKDAPSNLSPVPISS